MCSLENEIKLSIGFNEEAQTRYEETGWEGIWELRYLEKKIPNSRTRHGTTIYTPEALDCNKAHAKSTTPGPQALLAMLFESQSNPSYRPSPEVAQVLWMYQ